jgi:hypothetical protein
MARRETYEDLSFILLLLPLIASGGYALLLWTSSGLSAILPQSVYLAVTRSPQIFLLGLFGVLAATFIDVTTAEPEKRWDEALVFSRTLQRYAIIILVLAFATALYSAGFDFGAAASNFVVGRYNVIFPALLFLFSFAITTPLKVEKLANPQVLALIALLAVPFVLDEVGKRNVMLGLLGSFVLILLAGGVLFWGQRAKKAVPA